MNIATLRKIIEDESPFWIGVGIVIGAARRGLNVVSVRLLGSGRVHKGLQTCDDSLEIGDKVLVARVRGMDRPVVVGRVLEATTSSSQSISAAALSPPANLTATGGPRIVRFEWDTYPGEIMCYQVQTNSSAVEAGATEVLVTRGSYYMYETTVGTTRYGRVRAIRWFGPNDVMFSAWSVWVNGTATSWDDRYRTETELSSTNNAEGASMIGIEDFAGHFDATNVEAALAELVAGNVSDLEFLDLGDTPNSYVGEGGLYARVNVPESALIFQDLHGIEALTAAEIDQLENIGAETISAAQWAYLGGLDQDLDTAAAPTFTDLNLLSSDSANPVLEIQNTNGDAQCPTIDFWKNTATPADNDDIGAFDFFGETDTGAKERYAYWLAEMLDVSNGATGGGMAFMVTMNGTDRFLMRLSGYNGTPNQGEIVFNEDGQDVDFIVEAVGVADALQVRGSDGQITLGALGVGTLQTDAGGVVSAGAGGGGAPVDAEYLTLALDAGLTAERRFVPGAWLAGTDGGADGDYDLAAQIGSPTHIDDNTGAMTEFATVQLALNACDAGDIVLVPPMPWVENLTWPAANVKLLGFPQSGSPMGTPSYGASIIGTIDIGNNVAVIQDLYVTGDITMNGATASLTAVDCRFDGDIVDGGTAGDLYLQHTYVGGDIDVDALHILGGWIVGTRTVAGATTYYGEVQWAQTVGDHLHAGVAGDGGVLRVEKLLWIGW